MARRTLQPQSFFDDGVVRDLCDELGVKIDHAYALWRFLIRNEGTTFSDCPGLPKRFYETLNQHFVPLTSKVEKTLVSADNSTVKLLVRLQDGALVETVVMRYDRKNNPALLHKARSTVCISSQVGCKMGCTFCATGTMGFISHLTAGEIVEQLVHASRVEPIKNVVFMGMGEPLDNYENVVTAVKTMIDQRRFNLGAGHVCVSTVGVIPRMKQLLRDVPGVRLALSLHAPTQEMRLRIVPTAKAYPIEKLIAVLDLYLAVGRVMIEYIVIGGVNNSPETAHKLGQLFAGKDVIINLIPYNPTDVAEDFVPPTTESVVEFEKILQQDYSLLATIRRTMGQDIEGACGQLVVKNTARNSECGDGRTNEDCNCNNNTSEHNHSSSSSSSSSSNSNNTQQQQQQQQQQLQHCNNDITDMEDLHTPKVKADTGETIPSESFWGNIFKKFF